MGGVEIGTHTQSHVNQGSSALHVSHRNLFEQTLHGLMSSEIIVLSEGVI
jgi:hypothetical protein